MHRTGLSTRGRHRPPSLLVATSACHPEDERLAAYRGHFDHFLVKPYNLGQLETLLDSRTAALHLGPVFTEPSAP